jgi:hypothetical protein
MGLRPANSHKNQMEGGQFCPQPALSRLWPPKRRLRPGLAALRWVFDRAAVSRPAPWPGDREKCLKLRISRYAARETDLLRKWPAAGPKLLWSVPVDEGYAGAAVVGGPGLSPRIRRARLRLLRARRRFSQDVSHPGSFTSRHRPTGAVELRTAVVRYLSYGFFGSGLG